MCLTQNNEKKNKVNTQSISGFREWSLHFKLTDPKFFRVLLFNNFEGKHVGKNARRNRLAPDQEYAIWDNFKSF